MIKDLRRLKVLYELYNIFSYNKLKYQRSLYKNYNLKKSYYSSLTSKDLPEDSLTEHPWLDKEDSRLALSQHPKFNELEEKLQKSILHWSSNGYAILEGFYSEEKVEAINGLLNQLMHDKRMPVREKRKIMFAVGYSDEMRNLVNTTKLLGLLELLLGRKIDLFQSVNFLKGSEDPAHSDFIHMSTYPYGYLMAAWIALEDMDMDNGPLFYYPGSHKLPYLMNSHFDHGGNRWLLGKDYKRKYELAIQKLLEEQNFEKKYFTAKKGDVLIWHANLLHGGSKVEDPARTRKSMVLHYFGQDVIRYHEITQRPSFKTYLPKPKQKNPKE